MMTELLCPLCPDSLVSFNVSGYVKHIQVFHSHQPHFSLTCGIRGCVRTFKNFGTFKNHVSAKHNLKRVATFKPTPCNDCDEPNTSGNGDEDNTLVGDQDVLTYESSTTSQQLETDTLKYSAALLLLRLKEKQKLTQVALQGVIEGVTDLFQRHLSILHAQVKQKLLEAEVQASDIPGLNELFDEDVAGHPFLGLETQYQQMTYFKSHLNLLEPVSVYLGEERVWRGIGRKRRCVVKKDEAFYVPILHTLANLLNNKTVYEEVTNGHSSEDNVLRDYCDGKVYKKHALFSTKKNSLQINLYFDEVELCNALGSKAKIHKLGAFYFTLGNLHPRYRSKLSSIHLVALVSNPNLSKYGIDAVIKPFVGDMKKLEDGYDFEVNGKMEKFYGTLAVVSADNLGSLALGGFKESCTAYRCCRHCMATQETARTLFKESQFTLRDKPSHIHQCVLLSGENSASVSKTYGINRDALLNELRYFHVCEGGLIPDVMHDVLEGALAYEAKLMLVQMITKNKYFTLDQLNTRLENMDLGYMEIKDRPTLISDATFTSSSTKLKQQAAQMWLLGRVLPLVIGDYIPDDDEYWANFLKLLDITDFLFSPNITSEHVSYLRTLIYEHHEDFKDLYPDQSVIPKMHFMVHMPRLILQFGPLVCHWTMRYEAKHSYFKKLAQSMGNFINISYSLAMRHQQLECYHNACSFVGARDLEIGPGSMVLPCVLQTSLDTMIVSSAYDAKWIKIGGHEFRPDAGFVYAVEDDLPLVGQIKHIYVINESIVVFKAYTFSSTYLPHFHSYSLNKQGSNFSFFEYKNLLLTKPVHIRLSRTLPDHSVIILPHNIMP